ncbi:hypothetical protein HNY73_005474 [Argiope bruennichi]|uniref:Paired domain-containing protein n=1 Tax=Argiope bruennichi TaxID=94029 RepID=A0A8T0FJ90_ARGBR|nr:hypothetical protein HNY73_005474 [Argiope bruennichi]
MTSKSKELEVSVENMIIRLRNEGLTYRAIGVQLNISLFTVRSVVKKFKETGSTENKTRSGRPGIFSTREKRAIINKVIKYTQTPLLEGGKSLPPTLQELSGCFIDACTTVLTALLDSVQFQSNPFRYELRRWRPGQTHDVRSKNCHGIGPNAWYILPVQTSFR